MVCHGEVGSHKVNGQREDDKELESIRRLLGFVNEAPHFGLAALETACTSRSLRFPDICTICALDMASM